MFREREIALEMKFLRNFWCNNDDNFFFFLILKFCYVYTSFYELDDKLCEKQRILKKYCTRNVYTIHKDCRKIDVASFFFFFISYSRRFSFQRLYVSRKFYRTPRVKYRESFVCNSPCNFVIYLTKSSCGNGWKKIMRKQTFSLPNISLRLFSIWIFRLCAISFIPRQICYKFQDHRNRKH